MVHLPELASPRVDHVVDEPVQIEPRALCESGSVLKPKS